MFEKRPTSPWTRARPRRQVNERALGSAFRVRLLGERETQAARDGKSMYKLYIALAAVNLLTVLISGVLWTIVDLVPGSKLRQHLRDIQAVHFGSLYLVPTLLGLAYAFDPLQVPARPR